jgi:hypothetical protein
MATGTLPDSDQDTQIDPNESDKLFHDTYHEELDKLNKAETVGDMFGEDDKNPAEKETETSTHINNFKGDNLDQPKLQRVLGFAKKRGGIIGLIGLLGVGGGLMASLFAPAGMLINLMENFSLSNDTSSIALEQRFLKSFGFSTQDGSVLCTGSKIKCSNMNKISNRGLYQLNKKGITVTFPDGTTYEGKRTGYPSKNPSIYHVDLDDGAGVRNIKAKDLPGFLANNPKMAAKLLGTSGAFNLRVKAWTGKHITNKFFKKFGLKRNGGLADGIARTGTPEERRAAMRDKLTASIPDASKISGVTSSIERKITDQLGKAKKGGAGYVAAVGTCIGIKAPMFVAAGVAAVQLAQILPLVMDVVLSPGDKQKSVAVGANFTSDDAEGIATLLTERVEDPDTGEVGSALDSEILQSAAGINTGRPEVSPTLTPGLAYLTSPLVLASFEASKTTQPACNAIMSPAAMYTALAIDSAVTVAASATIIGGVVKIVASLVISEVVAATAGPAIANAATPVLTDLAKSEAIPGARGKALGDVLGIAATGFFSGGAMSRHIPGLTESQNAEFEVVKQENEEFNRQMAVASLSPFDTSSRYTFLGSIVHNMQTAVIASPSYNGSLSSIFSSILNVPGLAMSSKVSAADGDNSCSYAKDFGLDTGDPTTTPAISVSGLPCTGLTKAKASMPTGKALDLIAAEGWFNEEEDVPEDATIEDLVLNGYIAQDTPLYDYIEDCSNPETGDYIFNSAGCTINTSEGSKSIDELNTGELEGLPVCDTEDEEDCPTGGNITTSSDALNAMPVFLLDYQNHQIINGEDDLYAESEEETAMYDTPESASDSYISELSVESSDPVAMVSFEKRINLPSLPRFIGSVV